MSSTGKENTVNRKRQYRNGRGVRFERHASRIAFDPASSTFVVTWAKCGLPEEQRLAAHMDPVVWLPSIAAMATLFDRGCVPHKQFVYAAKAIGRAWIAGDRDYLDTEGARKAAELVSDLSSMCVDPSSDAVARDVGQAMRHLLDEIAAVRFANAPDADFDETCVMAVLDKAAVECLSTAGFIDWPPASKRRRFLYCLNKRERTEVTYTLASLLFDSGSCPLLSLTDRRILRMQAIKESGLTSDFSTSSMSAFFRYALSKMRNMKIAGEYRVSGGMTQQQLVDSVMANSPQDIDN